MCRDGFVHFDGGSIQGQNKIDIMESNTKRLRAGYICDRGKFSK